MLKIIRRIAIVAIVCLVVWLSFVWINIQAERTGKLRQAQESGGVGVTVSGSEIGGPFTMVDHTGRTVTEADYAGRFKLIYFGYTFCPDVCPTELQRMVAALDLMGDTADAIVPIFVTIDPARDTPEQMAHYVDLFHPRLVGLTGSEQQVAAMADQWRVYYARSKADDSTEYLMDHSSFIYLMGRDDKLLKIFRPATSAEDMAKEIISLINANDAG